MTWTMIPQSLTTPTMRRLWIGSDRTLNSDGRRSTPIPVFHCAEWAHPQPGYAHDHIYQLGRAPSKGGISMIEERPAKRLRSGRKSVTTSAWCSASLRMTAEQWRIFDAHGGSHGYVSRWTRAQESSPSHFGQSRMSSVTRPRKESRAIQRRRPYQSMRGFFRHAASAALVDHIDLLFNEALAIFQMLHLAVV